MKKFTKLVVTSPSFSENSVLREESYAIANEVVFNAEHRKWTPEELVLWVNDSKADAMVLGTEPMHASMVAQLRFLKAIGKFGVGCDNVDQEALRSHQIFFSTEGGVNRRSVTELALGVMIGHCRNLIKSMRRMENGEWQKKGGVELSHRKVGIVGLGFIGTDLARILRVMGCQVLFHDVSDKKSTAAELGLTPVSYETLLKESDIVSFHVPGGRETHHMFGESQIAMVQKHALIVNTSRGTVVDFSAVTEAVRSGKLGGFGCDVYPTEPFRDKQFRCEDGFYFTPHIGGNSAEAVLAMGRSALAGLQRFLNSRTV